MTLKFKPMVCPRRLKDKRGKPYTCASAIMGTVDTVVARIYAIDADGDEATKANEIFEYDWTGDTDLDTQMSQVKDGKTLVCCVNGHEFWAKLEES